MGEELSKICGEKDDDDSKPSSRRDSQIDMKRSSKADGNSLKPRRDSKSQRRTSLADLIPDWPVLTQRKKATKVTPP